MRQKYMAILAASMMLAAVIAGCANGPSFNQRSEASKSAIRAAEEVGANKLPSASLYLQLSKEELARAEVLANGGEKEQAASMLTRAEADAELAITLSHVQAEKTEAMEAMQRVRQLRQDNQLPVEGSNP
jgi:hypothetical protein